MIFPEIEDLAKILSGSDRPHVLTSGAFDPMHIGHVRCILHGAAIAKALGGIFTVIVNGDGFLKRKKGAPFMREGDRLELVAALRGVDYVTVWDDETPTVIGALEILKPSVFAKGGDRATPDQVPEWDICQKLKIEVMFGVGGGKICSSSELIEASAREQLP